MSLRTSCLLSLLFVCVFAGAQETDTKRIFSGVVVDSQGVPVESALVVCKSAGNVSGVSLSDSLGRFSVRDLPDTIDVEISQLSFESYREQIVISVLRSPFRVVLESVPDQLEAATVTSNYIKRQGNNFTLFLKNNPAAKGKSSLQILNSLPGIHGLNIYGGESSTVYVNDHELKLPPDQLLTYLASLKAEDVNFIKILPTGSAAYSSEKKGGVIRVQLRHGESSRISGNIVAPLSVNAETGSMSTNSAVTLNYIAPKFSTFTFASFNWLQEERIKDSYEIVGNKEFSDSKRKFHALILDQSFLYDFDAKHSLGAAITLFSKPKEKTTVENNNESRNSHIYNDLSTNYAGGSLVYNQKIGEIGSGVKVTADYFIQKDEVDESFYESTLETSSSDITKRSFSGQGDAIWILPNEDSEFDFGASYMQMHGNQDYLQFGNENTFDYNEKIFGAYVDFITPMFDSAIDLDAGLRFESALINDKDRFNNLLPTLSATWYYADDDKYLTLDFENDLSRPTMWDYNPVVYRDGEHVFYTGAENLKSEVEYSVSLTHSLKNNIVRLSYNWKNDAFDECYSLDGNNVISTYRNLGSRKNIELYADSRYWLVKKKIYGNSTLTGNFFKYDTYNESDFDSFDLSLSTGINFLLPNSWSFAILGEYNSPIKSFSYKTSAAWRADFSLSKKFNDNWKIALSSYKLLSNPHSIVTSREIDYKVDMRNYFKTVTLTLTYSFGSTLQSPATGVVTNGELKSRSSIK